MLPRLTLILGGARSGKSREAETLVTTLPPPWRYVATAQALDEEMRQRIALHRERRRAGWETHEAPLDLVGIIRELAQDAAPILVDCLTLWLSNLMLMGRDPGPAVAALADAIRALAGPAILISNEVGMGIVPEHKLGREFRDWQGRANQEIARACDAAILIAAGLPLRLKPAAAVGVQLA